MILVRSNVGVSTVECIDRCERANQTAILLEIGARLADVFGADRILWVEGPTEEAVFPKIIRQLLGVSLGSTLIRGVFTTGDLEGPDAEKTASIYRRLSEAGALLPPAIAFVFDREDRSEEKRADLEKRIGGRVKFLPRRAFENYLLNAGAIAVALSEVDSGASEPYEASEIEQLIEEKMSKVNYYRPGKGEIPDQHENRLKEIRGDKLLEDVFAELSQTRVEYRKTRDSVRITELILQLDSEEFRQLKDFLQACLSQPA